MVADSCDLDILFLLSCKKCIWASLSLCHWCYYITYLVLLHKKKSICTLVLDLQFHAGLSQNKLLSCSISSETVLLCYQLQGTKIVDESHDQDTTDLHKCISFIAKNSTVADKSNLCILVLGALGGRFDHEMGNINVLHIFPNINIILLSNDCLIFLLPRTHNHEIHVERSIEGPHCGLIPIGMPSTSTTTTGLRWNLDNTSMSYGGLISTSNIVEDDKVTVTSESDLIWTISLQNWICRVPLSVPMQGSYFVSRILHHGDVPDYHQKKGHYIPLPLMLQTW